MKSIFSLQPLNSCAANEQSSRVWATEVSEQSEREGLTLDIFFTMDFNPVVLTLS